MLTFGKYVLHLPSYRNNIILQTNINIFIDY